MVPQSKADALAQAAIYALSAVGMAVSWAADNKYLAILTGVSTVVLIWSNVLLNRSKRRKTDAETALIKAEAKALGDKRPLQPR